MVCTTWILSSGRKVSSHNLIILFGQMTL